MKFESDDRRLSRRDFLQTAALGAGLTLLSNTPGFAAPPDDAFRPFKVGLQSYSLRHFGLDDALAKTQTLGLPCWEAFPGHMPITDDPKVISDYKGKLSSHNITLLAYGVVDFSNDEADARKKFAFAKAMNIKVLSAYPKPDSFALLDRLTAEYKINLAIHNHGPGDDLYNDYQKTLQAVQGHSPRIGACDDTGHFIMADVNPVTAADKLGKRLYDIHLKAVKLGADNKKEFTEIGVAGSLLDTMGLFRLLYDRKYNHLIALEYEDHEEDPMPQLQECVAAVKRFCKEVRGVGILGGVNQ